MRHEFEFSICEKVTIDNHKKHHDIVGVVLAVTISGKEKYTQYKVGWMEDGRSYEAWFDAFRLQSWGE
jgi:hypothetical protein